MALTNWQRWQLAHDAWQVELRIWRAMPAYQRFTPAYEAQGQRVAATWKVARNAYNALYEAQHVPEVPATV